MSDEWEPAERVQKNDQGKYRAMIGGEWVPVEKAQKNEQGEFRVQRAQAPWLPSPSTGEAGVLLSSLAKGGAGLAGVPALIAGGLESLGSKIHAPGPTRTKMEEESDKAFRAYEKIRDVFDPLTPKGRQTIPQRIVGGVGELAPSLFAGGPELAATTAALNQAARRVEGGMGAGPAVAMAPIEGAANVAGMKMPLNIGGGLPGVAKAIAAQTGLAAGEDVAKMWVGVLSDDKQAEKEARAILDNIIPGIGTAAAVNFGASALAYLLGKVPGARAKFADYMKKRGKGEKAAEATPPAAAAPASAQPAVAPPPPPGAPAPTAVPKQFRGVAHELEPPVERPTEAAAEQKPAAAAPAAETPEAKKARETAAWEAEMKGRGAGDLTGIGEPAAAQPAAPAAPKAIDRQAKIKPVILKDGDVYGQHPIQGLTDVDRASLSIFAPHAYPTTSHTPQQLVEELAAKGISEKEAEQHGMALERELVGKHWEHVGGREWTAKDPNDPRAKKPIALAGGQPRREPPVPPQPPVTEKPASASALTPDAEIAAANAAEAARKEGKAVSALERDLGIQKYEGPTDKAIKAERARTLPAALKRLGINAKQIRAIIEDGKDQPDLSELATRLESEGYPPIEAEKLREMIQEAVHDKVPHYPSDVNYDLVNAKTRAERLGDLETRVERAHDTMLEAWHEDPTKLHEAAKSWDKIMGRVAERAISAGATRAEAKGMVGRITARATAAGGLLAAAQAAKADDGSDTNESNWLTGAAVIAVLGGTVAYGNRELIGRKLSAATKDIATRLKTPMVETGAKQIVDKWRGRAAVMALNSTRAALEVKKADPGTELGALAGNEEFQSQVAFVADQYQRAKWRNAENMGVRLNAAIEHWDLSDAKTKAMLEDFKENTDPSVDFPMFHYETGFAGIEAGLRAGMKLAGKDSGEVYAQFAVNAWESMSRGNEIRDLKGLKMPDGKPAMVQAGADEFKQYARIGDAWGGTLADLEGWRIHPALVNDFKLSFNTYEPGNFSRSLMAVNLAAKRAKVGFSAFHMMSLTQGKLGDIMGRALKGELPDPEKLFDARKQLMEGGPVLDNGLDGVQTLVQAGLRLDAPLEAALGKKYAYHALDAAEDILNQGIPHLGTATAGTLKKADKLIQHATWDVVQTNFKVMTALKELESQMARRPGEDINKIAEEVASYANDVFGSLDWRRVGYEFKSRYGRTAAAELFSGKGKFWMDMAMFAPDWFMSTARTWINALPRYADGKIKWDEKNRIYARYLAGSAMLYAMAGTALNYYYTGKPMWDNEPKKKDATEPERRAAKMMVDRGDGTYIQLSKHFTDFPSFLNDMPKEILNKAAFWPSQIGQLTTNKQYLTPGWAPPITYSQGGIVSPTGAKDVAIHEAQQFSPISASALLTPGSDAERAIMGFMGMPLRGYTSDEKAAMKAAETEKRRSER